MAKNFSEQVSDVKVTLKRLNQVKKSKRKSCSFFKDSLLKWSELNFRKDFIDYHSEVRELSETLPQILLHQEVLVQSLLQRFCIESKNSFEALFDLLDAISRDIGREFFRYFSDTMMKFERLIHDGVEHEPEILKQLFTCFARLCKLLHEDLSHDISGTLQITKNLRIHKSANIRSLTVQGLASILKRAKNFQISNGVLHILREVEGDAREKNIEKSDFDRSSSYSTLYRIKCESAGALFAEAVRGTAYGLHSTSNNIFTVLFDPDVEFLAESHLFAIVNEMLRQVCSFGRRGRLEVLWDTLLCAIRTNLQKEKCNTTKINYHMKLISLMVKHNNGSAVENFTPIFEVFELTLEYCYISELTNQDESIQQTLFELIFNICDAHNIVCGSSAGPHKIAERSIRWVRLISIASSNATVYYLKGLNERGKRRNPAALTILKIFTSICLVKFFEEVSDRGIATASESCQILLECNCVDRDFLVANENLRSKIIDILQTHQSCSYPLGVLWGTIRIAPFCSGFEECHTMIESILDYALRKLEKSQEEKNLTEAEAINPTFAILVAGLQALLTLNKLSNVHSQYADTIYSRLFLRVIRVSRLSSGPLLCATELLESKQILKCSKIFLKTAIPEDFRGITSSNRHVRYANLKYLSALPVDEKEKSWIVVKEILSKFCVLNAHNPGKSTNLLSALKKYEVMLQAIFRSLDSNTIPIQSIKLVTSTCIGALHIKLSSLWPSIISTLGTLINMYPEAREVFTFHLEETQLKCISKLILKKESEIQNFDTEIDEVDLEEFITLQINQVEYGVNPWILLNLLLDTLSKFSFSDNIFFHRISAEFLKYSKCFEGHANNSGWKTGMQKWLHSLNNSFGGGYHFLGFKECSEIYCKLLEMVQSNDPQLACLAIRCLGQWDLPYLTNDIILHLQAIASPKTTRQALTTLCFAKDVSEQKVGITVIEKRYRSKIVPLVIQVLLPRLHERSSRNISICKASYSWMAELNLKEIYPLMRTIFSIVVPDPLLLDAIVHLPIENEVREEICLDTCLDFSMLSMKSINTFFRKLEDLLQYLGEHVYEYMCVLVPISMRLICTVARICEEERNRRVNKTASSHTSHNRDGLDQNKNSWLHKGESKNARNVRAYSLRVLADLLYRHPHFKFCAYSNDLVSIMIPLLLRLSNESSASTPPVILQVVRSLASSNHLLLTLLRVEESTSSLKFVWEILKSEVASEQSRVLCLDIAENLIFHTEVDNSDQNKMAKQILMKHSKELFESLQILVLHPIQIKNCLRRSQSNSNLERTFTLVGRLSRTLGGKYAVYATISSLERLARFPRLDERMFSELLSGFSTAFLDASANVNPEDIDKFWTLIIPFLGKARTIIVRSGIIDALSAIAKYFDSLSVSTKILQELNSTMEDSLGEINFKMRLKSYEKLTTNWFAENSEQNIKAILFQALHDMGSSDFAICHAAQSAIKNFIDAFSMPPCKVACTLIYAEIILPGIKRSITSTEKSKRAVAIHLIGHLAKTQPHCAPGLSILSKSDPEADFFMNITHLQSHRRNRALAQLEVASTSLKCDLSTILDYYIPIVLMCVADPETNVAATAVSVLRQISSKLPWPAFKDILRKLFRKFLSNHLQNSAYLRAFASVLENLDCFSKLKDEEEFLDLFKEFHPKLIKFLPDNDNEIRSNKKEIPPALILSCAHIISFLPEHELKIQLQRLTMLLCASLSNRSQGIRDAARVSLSNVARVFRAPYLPYIIRILRAQLINGFQLHVLGSLTYDILKVTTSEARNAVVDALLPEVLPILDADIFGELSEEREISKIKEKTAEARHSRSLESIELLSAKASFPASMPILLSLVTKRLRDCGNIQNIRKIEQVLLSIHKGILLRTGFEGIEILAVARSILSLDSSGEFLSFDIVADKGRSTTQENNTIVMNSNPVITLFALRLIKGVLKHFSTTIISEGKRKEYSNILEDTVPVLFRLMTCTNHKIPLICLQILSDVTNMRLSKFEISSGSLIRRIIALLNSSNNDPQLAQDCLRLLSNLMLRYVNVSLSNAQYRAILQYAFDNIKVESSTSVCHSVLRAILSRRPLLSEIYMGMDGICCLIASGISEHSRKMCAQIFLQFLLDYPLGARRLQHYVEQLIANLKYECPVGRASVLNTLHAVILKFPKSVLQDTAEVIFLPLVVQLGTDASSMCRRSAGETISALLSRTSEEKIHVFLTWLQKWFVEEQNMALKRLSVQVMNIALGTCSELVMNTIRGIWLQILSELEIRNFKKDEKWLLLYNLLLLIERIWEETPDFFRYPVAKVERTIFSIVQLLRHEHGWIQSSSIRILGQYLKIHGVNYSISSEDRSFQHDDVVLELAMKNSLLLFENNFKCSNISIELEVLRQNARNIASITLLFLSRNACSDVKSAEIRGDRGIAFIQRVGRYCVVASNCIREVSIRCLAGIIAGIDGEMLLRHPSILYELIFPCYICIDPKVNGISIEHRELAVEVLQLLRSLVEERHFNTVYTSVQSKVKLQRKRRKRVV